MDTNLKNLSNRKYYHLHKEEITQTIICIDCRGRYNRTVKARHLKTKKHLKGLKIKQELDFYKNLRERIKIN